MGREWGAGGVPADEGAIIGPTGVGTRASSFQLKLQGVQIAASLEVSAGPTSTPLSSSSEPE